MSNKTSAGVWVAFDCFAQQIEPSDLNKEFFEVAFGGALMIQVRGIDLEVLNAVDGYGHNLQKQYEGKKVTVLRESPAPQSIKRSAGIWEAEFIDWYLDPEQPWCENGNHFEHAPVNTIVNWLSQNEHLFTPVSAKNAHSVPQSIKEGEIVYVPIEIKEGCEMPSDKDEYVHTLIAGKVPCGNKPRNFGRVGATHWLKPITIPSSSISKDNDVTGSSKEGEPVELLSALLNGKPLVRLHVMNEKATFWCETDKGGQKHFYVHGWGSACGAPIDRLLDVINNPTDWAIESSNE